MHPHSHPSIHPITSIHSLKGSAKGTLQDKTKTAFPTLESVNQMKVHSFFSRSKLIGVTCSIFLILTTLLGKGEADAFQVRSNSAYVYARRTSVIRGFVNTKASIRRTSVLHESRIGRMCAPLLMLRGGSTSTGIATAPAIIFKFMSKIMNDASSSKARCWTILICSILFETAGASLSKHARDTGSFSKFLVACCLNLIW
jgi:hypothetical protein